MKFPIDSSTMRGMPANMYIKKIATFLKKLKAKGLTETPCVVIDSHEYSCGKIYAFTYYGSQSQINVLFKELQKEKKDNKSLAFAKGFCRLSDGASGELELDFALKGFIKPDQVKKSKKKLFMKMGVTLKDVVKGTFAEVGEVEEGSVDEVNEVPKEDSSSGATQSVKTDEKSLEEDSKSILVSASTYVKADKRMKEIILPLLRSKTGAVYTKKELEVAKTAYTSLVDFLDVCAKEEGKQANILDEKPKLKALKNSILDNLLKKKYFKIWKKVESEYKKGNESLNEEDLNEEEQAKISRIETLLNEIKELEALEVNQS